MDNKRCLFFTRSGKEIDLVNMRPDDVVLDDITGPLSKLCRYAGHTNCFYSVAQHSLLVSRMLPRALRIHGLLHDAAEAYLCDVPLPVKRLISGYERLERNVLTCILHRLGVENVSLEQVHRADRTALKIELFTLFPGHQQHDFYDRRVHAEYLNRILRLTPEMVEQELTDAILKELR